MGDRFFNSERHFGRAVSTFQSENLPRCWAEIDLGAIQKNALTGADISQCGIIAIIKANGYGLGAVPVAKCLEKSVAMFGVANVKEAIELRKAKIRVPILVLGTCLPIERAAVITHRLVPCVSSLLEAREWDAHARKNGVPKLKVHIVIDTGMGRLGFLAKSWTPTVIKSLLRLKNLKLEGLCSHFPSADEDIEYTREQIQQFGAVRTLAFEHGLRPSMIHLGNSAGILGYPELPAVSDYVRPGLMLFGISPLPKKQHLLHPVLSLKSRILLIRDLPKGQGVSYGRTFVTRKPMRVATLSVGYADGYPRGLSGQKSDVLIHGQRCRILGRITMDQIMVDVTRVPARIGDEVTLIGKQDHEEITAAEVAQKAGTIPWEILTRMTARVERFYKES
jgi:alanine racemase